MQNSIAENFNPKDCYELIKAALSKLQKIYTSQGNAELDKDIEALFARDGDISYIGAGAEDWAFGIVEIKNIIKAQISDESKHLSNPAFDIDNAVITLGEKNAVATLTGVSRNNITEAAVYQNSLDKLDKIAEKPDFTEMDMMQVMFSISRALYEANLGEKFAWPFRMTAFLVLEDSQWLFKHIKLSFAASNYYETRFTSEIFPEKFKKLEWGKSIGQAEEIRSVLSKFQKGYDMRDLSFLDDFVSQIFTNDEDMVIIGTDGGELYRGADSGRELIEGDWTYWGSFDLNMDEAYISVNNDMAWVAAKAIVRMAWPQQRTYNSVPDLIKNYVLPSDCSSKDKLLKILWKTSRRLYDAQQGEKYIVPMKFAGVLVKKDGEWKFKHMHFSDNIDDIPEERLMNEIE